jgi:hypothetical protein
MATNEKGRKGGTSFPFTPDLRTKTARPTSVGPHGVKREQEDPGNPGIIPEQGYAAEIARNNAAAAEQPAGSRRGVTSPGRPKPGSAPAADKGKPRDTPPLRGTTEE